MWTIAIAALLLLPMILAAMIAFGTRAPPPPLQVVADAVPADLPPPAFVKARDGTPLLLRLYRTATSGDRAAIVIHGSAATGASMHLLATALRDAGIAAYVPDIRGHGGSGRHGDIDYAGQLDDDLADVTAAVRAAYPGAALTLIGFSAGGGFALRIAATPLGPAFERVVLVAPMLGARAPTVRPSISTWVRPHGPRIAALKWFNRCGIHAFDGLPALAFAAGVGGAAQPVSAYSFRLMQAFGTRDYAADVRNARTPLAVLVGGEDKFFDAPRFAPAIQAQRPDTPVTVVPALGHVDTIADRRGHAAIIAAVIAAIPHDDRGHV